MLWQYRRGRSKKWEKFGYWDMKSVYNIVLFEFSLEEFYEFSHVYIHGSEQKSGTGIKIELFRKYVFIPVDIFMKTQHNKNITGKLNAGLMEKNISVGLTRIREKMKKYLVDKEVFI